jgi:hypothetical protein
VIVLELGNSELEMAMEAKGVGSGPRMAGGEE